MALSGCGQQVTVDTSAQSAMAESGNAVMKELNWEAYSELMHPEALAKYRMILQPAIEALEMADKPDTVSLFNQFMDLNELREKTDNQFFVDMMNTIFGISPEMGATFQGMENTTLGAIMEGDNISHVVMRTKMTLAGSNITEMNVVTVQKDGTDWKLSLNYKIEGIIMMVQRTLNQLKV